MADQRRDRPPYGKGGRQDYRPGGPRGGGRQDSPPLSEAHAPYSFVPFSGEVLLPYKSATALPRHDRLEPGLLTGEIEITLLAETAVFIQGEKGYFFRGADGRLALPGSSIRGMVRENMQILGLGLLRPGEDVADHQIYFRQIAGGRGSTAAALKDYYHDVLKIKLRPSPGGKPRNVPTVVKAGYLCCEDGRYLIRPVRGEVIPLSRRSLALRPFQTGQDWRDCAREVKVRYQLTAGQPQLYLPDSPKGRGLPKGRLLYTGKSVKNPNPVYLFPEPDPAAKPVTLSDEDVLSYREDWERRSNALGQSRSFWQPPAEGERKAVFYVENYEGHTYWGMSRFLRVGYRYTVTHGLPKAHRDLAGGEALDYPRAILGFTRQDTAYRSRVSFGDLTAAAGAEELPPRKLMLAEPKPSYYPGYILGRHYNDETFALRGYKQYWLRTREECPDTAGSDRMVSTLRPLPAGTEFRGKLRYSNLTSAELGLLLWCLRLEPGCWQSVGMGKPFGYGRMKLTIDGLREYDAEGLYGDLVPTSRERDAGAVEKYIRVYQQEAADLSGGRRPEDREELRDFFYIRSVLRAPGDKDFGYMELKQFANCAKGLPTLRDLRRRERR